MGKKHPVPSTARFLHDQIFFCPSCTTWRLRASLTPSPARSLRSSKRHASTWSSRTAINATKPVPSHLRPLYDSLVEVRKSASTHINTSRLQLALQGLESKNPTIRLAILGLNVPDTARRIARLLLVDPLEEHQQWEEQLANGKYDYTRGLIIRFGLSLNSNIQQPNNSVPILYIPAGVLERQNLELLISSVNAPDDSDLKLPSTPSDTLLSPAVGTPTSSGGRQTIISQPVHQTLIVANGLDQLLAVSRLLASTDFGTKEDRDSIQVAVNLPSSGLQHVGDRTHVTDTKAAEEGLSAIRNSVKGAPEYEHKWMASGMTELTSWMVLTTKDQTSPSSHLAAPIESLIKAVLEATSSSIEAARRSSSISAAESSLSPQEQLSLKSAIDDFSRSAHQELQSGLASAWSSRNWRKLAWYKLFWRVDDVGLIVTDLVNSAWLPRTERAVYELSGRLVQVGINPIVMSELELATGADQSDITLEAEKSPIKSQLEPLSQLVTPPHLPASATSVASTTAFASTTLNDTTSIPVITNPDGLGARIDLKPATKPEPLTTSISSTRRTYILNSTTDLSSTAQQLILRTLSLTGFTGGLTMLTYLSSLSATLYEAGTIFAVGTVYALWTLQKGWMKATRRFEDGLFQQGREVILDITNNMRQLTARKSQITLDPVETSILQRADDAVQRAKSELQQVTTKHRNGDSSGKHANTTIKSPTR